MLAQDLQLSYRRAAIEGASPIGLVIALYDQLTTDYRRAAAAIRRGDIEGRIAELNHALTVLAQLESWIDRDRGGELAVNLTVFYGHLRARMMEASLRQNAALLDELIGLVLHVRTAWQQKDVPTPTPSASITRMTAVSA